MDNRATLFQILHAYRGPDNPPAKCCATCCNSTPTDNGGWLCSLFNNAHVPSDISHKGCAEGEHIFLPHAMPWPMIEAEDGWVVYDGPDGFRIVNCAASGFGTTTGDYKVFDSQQLADGDWKL